MPAAKRARSSSSPPRSMRWTAAASRSDGCIPFPERAVSAAAGTEGRGHMSTVIGARAPAWLRIVAALALLWNCFGIYNYLMTVGVVGGADLAAASAMPAWVTGAFAIAVFGGALGC